MSILSSTTSSALTNSIRQNSIPTTTTTDNFIISSTNNSTRSSTPINNTTTSSTTVKSNIAPVLLNVLGASDGESILVLVVEEEQEDGNLESNNLNDKNKQKKKNKVGRVYGGSQGGDIHVWNLETLALTARLSGHEGAVLALLIIPERDWLVSSSGDGTIRIWHTPTLTALYIIHPPHDNVGDVFSLVWVKEGLLEEADDSEKREKEKKGKKGSGRLYAGSQDTSIQWIDLPPTFHLSPKLPSLSEHLTSSSSTSTTPSQPTHPPKPIPLPIHPFNTTTTLSSTPIASSSPPIHRAPNKFFDSLTLADRPLSALGTGRRGLNGGANVNGGILGFGSERRGREGNDLEGIGEGIGDGGEGEREGRGERRTMEQVVELQFEETHVVTYAHYGYLYCLELGKSNEKNVLVSGSGDELIKLWRMTQDALLPIATLESNSDAVLALAIRDNTAFAGHQGGDIKIWDLDTLTCIRNLKPHKFDILTISLSPSFNNSPSDFYAGSSNGTLLHFDKSFNLISSWKAHERIVLASTISLGKGSGGKHLLTGGNDAVIKIWDIGDLGELVQGEVATGGFQGQLFHSLSKLVSFKTIADDEHREDCRQGANYLKRVLRQLGAETLLLRGAVDRNPIVLATFKANSPLPLGSSKKRKRVLFYGHYDVVGAPVTTSAWKQDPFEMKGENGWIYGRGVSDNKGPILAVAAAASELRSNGKLEVDLVMVVEGEEETGSAGFQEAIEQNREMIGEIDVILVSNSYWIGEDLPCLTFGLRGVIHATVSIDSDQPDLHSGMQGGVVSEPLVDMVRILASLTDADGRVRIPGFLEDVRRLEARETALYDEIILRCANGGTDDKLPKHSHIPDPRRSLMVRWRQPALSIHKIEVSSQAQKTLIPSWAKSSVSIRIVPDQPLTVICEQLKSHLQKAFKSLSTYNTLSVDINHVADWWLGDVDNPYFQSFAKCIEQEWSIKPLCIREGGSIPSLPFLQRELGAPAILYPMGLSSDSAHLANERIPIINLERGKTIVSNWLSCISKLP